MNQVTHAPARLAAWEKWSAWLLVTAGAILRIREFAAMRSLWLDEAMLALNIVGRSFRELALPLDYNQGAPLGFLLAQKSLLVLFGNQDYVLRLLPFAAGIGALILFKNIAVRAAGRWGLPALALFSFSGSLIHYASEAKQYSTDVFFGLLILAAFMRSIRPGAGPRDFIKLIISGLAALLMSHPALFAVGGAAIAWLLFTAVSRDRRLLPWLGLAGVVWAGLLGVLYWISLRSLAGNETLTGYWQTGFMPLPPWADLGWFRTTLRVVFRDPLGIAQIPAALLALAGLLHLLRRNVYAAAALGLPLVFVFSASALSFYPVRGRLILFAVPAIYLCVALGVDFVQEISGKWNPRAAWMAGAVLSVWMLAMPVSSAWDQFVSPDLSEHIKPMLATLAEDRQPGEPVYVYYGAIPAVMYYAPIYGLEDEAVIFGGAYREAPEGYIDEVEALTGAGRAWFLFTHICPTCRIDEQALILDALDGMGERLSEQTGRDAGLYLYSLP